MQGLVIAAGFGSRLRDCGSSKPLVEISGMPLIEIAIRQLVQAGVTEIVVVTGYLAEKVEAVLPAISAAVGIPVIAQRVEQWDCPNGYSVLAGAELMAGPYLLVMADHIFSTAILSRLVNHRLGDSGVCLAIDRRVNHQLLDPDDATWVQTDADGWISAIGKGLSEFNAVDCGAFLATEELSAAIKAAIAVGLPGSLSDGMQWLSKAGRATTLDIGDNWWIDVDDPHFYTLAIQQAPQHISSQTLLRLDVSACGGSSNHHIAHDNFVLGEEAAS
ncbi:MAG: NTP transferase domain-containing protein [Sphingomonadales bacterium]|nr:NTP transferase domain-containing protein [Sphingomonadales bacterium]